MNFVLEGKFLSFIGDFRQTTNSAVLVSTLELMAHRTSMVAALCQGHNHFKLVCSCNVA